MWDAIAANRRRSVILVAFMAVLLVGLGASIGLAMDPRGAPVGAGIAVIVWLILYLVAQSQGDGLLMMAAKARKISRKHHPVLWNVVEEMTIAAQLPKMPDVYVIQDPSPNAFATGKGPERCAVAVTTGLLKRLNRDELQGVIGHEVGHIENRDIRFLMLAGIMLGAIVLISHIFLRSLFYGSGRRSSGRGKGGGGGIFLVIAIAMAILAPIFAQILYFACSRRREYLADATGARLTRYPEGLASALEKISTGLIRRQKGGKANKVLAPMYIVNPGMAMAMGLFSTHPPTAKRIKILRGMSGGADYGAYEEAYREIEGKGVIGERALASSRTVEVREASMEPEEEKKGRMREVSLLNAELDGLAPINCSCGVGIRIPPDFPGSVVNCPRCGRANRTRKTSAETQTYRRKGEGWESVRCQACGRTAQLSPALRVPEIRCESCGQKIRIEGPT